MWALEEAMPRNGLLLSACAAPPSAFLLSESLYRREPVQVQATWTVPAVQSCMIKHDKYARTTTAAHGAAETCAMRSGGRPRGLVPKQLVFSAGCRASGELDSARIDSVK